MKIAAENARLRDEALPPTQPEIEAIANDLILENSDLFDTIVKRKQGVYIDLCSPHTKKDEPFMGAVRRALTKISSSKPPTWTELKRTWSAVSLRDFPYNISAAQLEKALHQNLQHHLHGQKLWIGNGVGGGSVITHLVDLTFPCATAR